MPRSINLFSFVFVSPLTRRSCLFAFHPSKSPRTPYPHRSNPPFRTHPICVGASPSAPSPSPAQDETEKSSTNSLPTQPLSELPNVPPFRLHPSDIFVLALFLLSFLLPVLRSTRPPRAHAIFSATLFTLGSALYVLRQRSVHRSYVRQLTKSVSTATRQAPDESEKLAAQLIEVRTSTAEDAELTRNHIARSDRARDRQHSELLRAFRGDLDELHAGFSLVKDAIASTNSEEIARLRAEVRQRDLDTGRLKAELAQASADAENATQREKVARTEADALRTTAAEAASLRERLIAAQTRTAALEERLDRVQNAVLAPQQQQEQQIPGGRVLRDALLNLGKSFPPAGRLLFDSLPPESTTENEAQAPPSLSASRSWPNTQLGEQAPTAGLGIPKDGGFGLNLFKKDQSDSSDPFSAMRGAFNEESSTASLPQTSDTQKGASGSDSKDPTAMVASEAPSKIEDFEIANDDQVDKEKKFRVQDNEMEEERLEDTPVENTGTPKVTSETRAEKARELVKRARAAPRNEAERLFATAVELLEAAPGGGIPRDAELGSTLLAWARNDVGADGAKQRLERAAGLLRGASTDDTAKFNLGLTLCTLASLETPPNCDPLYAEACEWYEKLAPSRTVCFNAGLAYIARARLAKGNIDNPPDPGEFYFIAKDMFSKSLEYAPDDSKSQAYVAECDEKIQELSS